MDKKITLVAVLAFATGLFGAAAPATAATATINYGGIINEVRDDSGQELDGSVVVGGIFYGSYTFNTDNFDTAEGPGWKTYKYDEEAPAGMTMSVTVGNYTFETENCDPCNTFGITVMNDFSLRDSYRVFTNEVSQTAGPSVAFQCTFGAMQFGLTTFDHLETFDSTSLPLALPPLENFESHNRFMISLGSLVPGEHPVFVAGYLTPLGSVPDVVGEALSWAQAMITSAGFVVGDISALPSATVPVGHIVNQGWPAGASVPTGAKVDLVVSGGPPGGPGAVQACCFADGSCQDLTRDECIAQGGTPHGAGTKCATSDCSEPPAPGIVAHYKLDETSGMIARDSEGTNDGILHGKPAWVPGLIDGALALDGIDDYVDCGNSPLFDLTEQITVAAWAKITSVFLDSTTRTIIGKGDTAWRLSIGPSMGKGGRKFLFAVCRDPCVNVVYSNTGVTAGQWHHVCGTYDHRTIRLYVDGALDTALRSTAPIPTNTHNVYIGENAEAPGQFFRGSIDDVRVYDYELSGDEIMQLVCTDPPPGDANGDCKVDFIDLAIFMSNWLRCDLPVQELCGQ